MAHNSKQEIYRALQQELQTEQFLRQFNRLKQSHPELSGFNTPQDLLDCFNFCEIASPPAERDSRNDRKENQSNLCNLWQKNRLLHLLVSDCQVNPKRKGWLMTLLLLISWKQMARTSYRFRDVLGRINPYDRFAPIYESYIDAFLEVRLKTKRIKHTPKSPLLRGDFGAGKSSLDRGDYRRFTLRIKDKAEYLIRQELKECNRFKPEMEIPAPEELPWQEEVEGLISEWTILNILTRKESELVINHLVYEYTFKELSKREKISADALRQQFHRAIEKLKPYLQAKHLIND